MGFYFVYPFKYGYFGYPAVSFRGCMKLPSLKLTPKSHLKNKPFDPKGAFAVRFKEGTPWKNKHFEAKRMEVDGSNGFPCQGVQVIFRFSPAVNVFRDCTGMIIPI